MGIAVFFTNVHIESWKANFFVVQSLEGWPRSNNNDENFLFPCCCFHAVGERLFKSHESKGGRRSGGREGYEGLHKVSWKSVSGYKWNLPILHGGRLPQDQVSSVGGHGVLQLQVSRSEDELLVQEPLPNQLWNVYRKMMSTLAT